MAFAAGTALLLGGIYVNADAATTPSDSSAGDTSADGTAATTEATTEASSSVSDVVDAANAFLDTLDSDQQSDVLLDFTEANATAWSNLPCGSTCRVGIEFSTLSDEQLTAAKAVIEAATGTGSGTGYDQVTQILAADDKLGETASGYGSGNYYLAFLGTPSTDGTWQLHFGGHHLALNLTYKDGEVEGTTPFFIGVEPTSWTGDDGTSYAPLAGMHDGMEDMLAGLSDDELAEAKLSESFSDVLLGPGEDGDFPETKEGLQVSELTDDQQELVLAAMEPWVDVADDTTAASVLSAYKADLDDTYIAYSGSSDLSAQGDYVRIDGPGVWIEFVCQNGVVYQSQVHYHTVYRDHDSDYGGEFSF
ncbi:DUF3500 domain-containing protein [Streptomyces hyaluromycini]|uniref:DUF3500 domain-containing protein n=1 Tax=Streptomyces hyaluromycini TaxID=1377993 RepID=UPI001FE34599|nr:DUF3500 domain-containing protein [Streptomyces hyaluromycini]